MTILKEFKPHHTSRLVVEVFEIHHEKHIESAVHLSRRFSEEESQQCLMRKIFETCASSGLVALRSERNFNCSSRDFEMLN
jgi:hypothetical protein